MCGERKTFFFPTLTLFGLNSLFLKEKHHACCLISFWVGRIVLLDHIKKNRSLENRPIYVYTVLMFDACHRSEHAYYRFIKKAVESKSVWCVDGYIYSVLFDVNCVTFYKRY